MAVTREQIHRTLRDILDELRRDGGQRIIGVGHRRGPAVDLSSTNSILTSILNRLNAVDFATETTLATRASESTLTTRALDTSVDGIEALLTTIDTSLNAIESDVDATRITSASIDTKVATASKQDSALSELESIDANWNILSLNSIAQLAISAILINIEAEIDNIEETIEYRHQLKYDSEFEITAAGGVIIELTPDSGNSMRNLTVRVDNDSEVLSVEVKIKDGTGSSALINRDLMSQSMTSTAPVIWPDITFTGADMKTSNVDNILNPDTLFISILNVSLDTKINVAVRAQMKEASGVPNLVTAQGSATITIVETRLQIDAT